MIDAAALGNFSEGLFNSANTFSSVLSDYTSKEAKLSTQNKQIQMQADIYAKLNDIRQRADFNNWQTEVNTFFEQIKSDMSNPESKYYCRNNKQAEMFNELLSENQLSVSEKVNQMVIQRQMEKDIVDTQNSKTLLSQMYAGQDYIDRANELDKGLYESGRISLEQYENQKDLNFKRGYQDMRTKTFDASLDDALAQGKSFEAFYADIEKAMPEMKATDASGIEKAFDKTALDQAIKKTCQQNYNARLSDIQQKNANALSSIVQSMRQQNTTEGKVSQARRGQIAMNSMNGLKLSENDRLQYSALFELALGGDNLKGSGSGSGSSKPTDAYENLIKAAPDTALQMVLDGDVSNAYDAVGALSYTLTEEWYTKDFKENYNKGTAERQEDFNMLYKGRVSSDSLTEAVLKKVIEKYPTAQNYANNNFKNLIADMKKNPKEYGDATVGELADFMMDTLMGADKNLTDEEFTEQFKKHVNDCYVEKCKYIELDKKGNLEKKFNANKASDVAKAAKLAQEKDYVYTYNGQERWATGKKEALEAEGGIIDTLKNAVAGTLDIPDAERGKIGYYYKPDAEHNDLTSTPIITYNNKAYEVIPDDNDKGFSLRDYRTGEIIEGKIGKDTAKALRAEAKAEAKNITSEASRNVAGIKKGREEELEKTITDSTVTPRAMKAGGGIDEDHWENYTDIESRTGDLRITARKMDNDAKKLDDKEFKAKYGIDKDVWNQDKVESRRFNLILKS